MAVAIPMVHPARAWESKPSYRGYSWTTFFWGPFPPLFRADALGFVIGIGLVAASFVVPLVPFIVWGFFYNGFHRNRLLAQGWRDRIGHPAGESVSPSEPPPAVPQPGLPSPSGWYPDPAGGAGYRYWDGEAWTDARWQ